MPANEGAVTRPDKGGDEHATTVRGTGELVDARLDCWIVNASLPRPGSIAGWCRRQRSAFICASAWPTASASSGCRYRARLALPLPRRVPTFRWSQELFTTTCDWRIASMGWMFTLFFVVLGVSAALWGGWLERGRPRKAGVVAACCWAGGLVLGAIGIYVHQLWLMWLGSGVIGGIGLGLGYISPVSTLIKWFPDHRGMATGMAIAGFGGGTMIGAPLAEHVDELFQDIDLGWRVANISRHGRHLLLFHDGRRVSLSAAA